MEDRDPDVRENALLQLDQEQYPAAYTSKRLARYLTHPDNDMVNRAGYAMSNFKDPAGIIPLMSSLTTVHTISTGKEPGSIDTSFDSNGGVGFSTGGPQTIERAYDNDGVRSALNEITGQDFNFDAELWREWYVINHTITDPGLRNEIDE